MSLSRVLFVRSLPGFRSFVVVAGEFRDFFASAVQDDPPDFLALRHLSRIDSLRPAVAPLLSLAKEGPPDASPSLSSSSPIYLACSLYPLFMLMPLFHPHPRILPHNPAS